MKWLIIGTGWISESFIKALRNNGETPAGIYSRTFEKGQTFAKRNNLEKVITTLEDLNDYDAVYIASPNTIHYNQAKIVINQEKDLLVEKPMTHSLGLTKELFALAKNKNVKLMEAYAHITNKEFHRLNGQMMKANFMQLSSKIKNETYKSASTFNKDMFGGVIPDLGVYYISLSIMTLGNVIDYSISNKFFLNEVIVSCDIELIHERGISQSTISKVEDGDNQVYLDNEVILPKISAIQENRMDAEVKVFIDGKHLDFYKDISIETARVVELLLK